MRWVREIWTRKNNDDLKRKKVDGLEVITGAINQLNNEFRSGTLSLELLGNSFIYMKNWFPDEYKLYGLSTIMCSFALPLLSRLFEGWDPLIKPADHVVNQSRAHRYYVGMEKPHGCWLFSGYHPSNSIDTRAKLTTSTAIVDKHKKACIHQETNFSCSMNELPSIQESKYSNGNFVI
ncbi:septin and tuftelin-interacting protein 1 homolog 1 [Tanacetum coccineum]